MNPHSSTLFLPLLLLNSWGIASQDIRLETLVMHPNAYQGSTIILKAVNENGDIAQNFHADETLTFSFRDEDNQKAPKISDGLTVEPVKLEDLEEHVSLKHLLGLNYAELTPQSIIPGYCKIRFHNQLSYDGYRLYVEAPKTSAVKSGEIGTFYFFDKSPVHKKLNTAPVKTPDDIKMRVALQFSAPISVADAPRIFRDLVLSINDNAATLLPDGTCYAVTSGGKEIRLRYAGTDEYSAVSEDGFDKAFTGKASNEYLVYRPTSITKTIYIDIEGDYCNAVLKCKTGGKEKTINGQPVANDKQVLKSVLLPVWPQLAEGQPLCTPRIVGIQEEELLRIPCTNLQEADICCVRLSPQQVMKLLPTMYRQADYDGDEQNDRLTTNMYEQRVNYVYRLMQKRHANDLYGYDDGPISGYFEDGVYATPHLAQYAALLGSRQTSLPVSKSGELVLTKTALGIQKPGLYLIRVNGKANDNVKNYLTQAGESTDALNPTNWYTVLITDINASFSSSGIIATKRSDATPLPEATVYYFGGKDKSKSVPLLNGFAPIAVNKGFCLVKYGEDYHFSPVYKHEERERFNCMDDQPAPKHKFHAEISMESPTIRPDSCKVHARITSTNGMPYSGPVNIEFSSGYNQTPGVIYAEAPTYFSETRQLVTDKEGNISCTFNNIPVPNESNVVEMYGQHLVKLEIPRNKKHKKETFYHSKDVYATEVECGISEKGYIALRDPITKAPWHQNQDVTVELYRFVHENIEKDFGNGVTICSRGGEEFICRKNITIPADSPIGIDSLMMPIIREYEYKKGINSFTPNHTQRPMYRMIVTVKAASGQNFIFGGYVEPGRIRAAKKSSLRHQLSNGNCKVQFYARYSGAGLLLIQSKQGSRTQTISIKEGHNEIEIPLKKGEEQQLSVTMLQPIQGDSGTYCDYDCCNEAFHAISFDYPYIIQRDRKLDNKVECIPGFYANDVLMEKPEPVCDDVSLDLGEYERAGYDNAEYPEEPECG